MKTPGLEGVEAQLVASIQSASTLLGSIQQKSQDQCDQTIVDMLNTIIDGMQKTFTMLFGNNEFIEGKPAWNQKVTEEFAHVQANVTSASSPRKQCLANIAGTKRNGIYFLKYDRRPPSKKVF